MDRGYIIVAQNSGTINYIECARTLCKNIKTIMPGSSVTLLTDKPIKSKEFDHVVLFPHGDKCKDKQWKLDNDWQVYDASPYEYTIKLEADMYLPRSIEHWWATLKNHDLVISTTIRNYLNEISDVQFYRRIIYENKLPDTYNAITYFRKSDQAKNFFSIVRDVFENWDQYKKLIKCYDQEQASTDFVYALAAHIMGPENCTLPHFTEMSMIHMKHAINGGTTDLWCDEFLFELHPESFRINTVPQLYPVHYHVKWFWEVIQSELYGS